MQMPFKGMEAAENGMGKSVAGTVTHSIVA